MPRPIRKVLQTQSDEPLPRGWIVWAFVIGIAAFFWGWQLGSWGFFQNILASLVLVGPGLLITNVFAARWRRRREAYLVELALVATLDVLGEVCGFVISIAKTVSPRVPEQFRLPEFEDKESLSLEQLKELLHASEGLLMVVPFGENLEPGPYLPSELILSSGSIGILSRRVRSALRRLSAVREFPKIMLNGEELLEAIDAPLPCQIRPNAAREFGVEFQVVDTKVSYETQHGLRDMRAKDVVTTQREDLIPWAATILYPLRNLLSEIGIRGNQAKNGNLDEHFSRLTSFDFDHRWIDRPRSLPTTSGSGQS